MYGGQRELRFGLTLDGGRFGVPPGTLVTAPASPDLWFDEGTQISFHAQPTGGFEFRSWKGGLAGQPNPALLLMDQPREATAVFEMVFGLDANVTVELAAATPQQIVLEARHANLPTHWTVTSGSLPEGLQLSDGGAVSGATLETGTFLVDLAVRDALGLEAGGALTLEVGGPVIGASDLIALFLLRPPALTPLQEQYLDRAGNGNGVYDLGDFRGYVLANSDAPTVSQVMETRPVIVPFLDLGREDDP